MPIHLEIHGESIEFDVATVTLGSDPNCTLPLLPLDDLAPTHAVIRKQSGRWFVEVREGAFIQVNDEPPSRMHWLNPGDIIRLTEDGPEITFDSGRAARTVPPAKLKKVTLSLDFQAESLADMAQIGSPLNILPPRQSLGPARASPRSLWIQIATGAALIVLALGVWQFSGSRQSNAPTGTTNPGSINSDLTNRVATTSSTNRPVQSDESNDRSKPVDSKSVEMAQASNPPDAAVSVKPSEPVETKLTETPKPADNPADVKIVKAKSSNPGSAVPSETLLAARDGVYVVFAKSSEGHCFRLGTAWAASRRLLVTSAAVALTAEEMQADGMAIVVAQPSRPKTVAVKGARMHAAYKQAVERAAMAREQITNPGQAKPQEGALPPEELLRRAVSAQARFDLGVLDIATFERLPKPLEWDASDLPHVENAEYTVVGFPFHDDQYRSESTDVREQAQERMNPLGAAEKSDKTLTLTMSFPDDVADVNWSGSPVLDRNRRVIGVYSRTSQADPKDKTAPLRHAIIWLGRLREFAPEFDEPGVK